MSGGGVNQFAHNMAARMAQAGFCMLAADVFRGHLFATHVDARKNMMSMDYPRQPWMWRVPHSTCMLRAVTRWV